MFDRILHHPLILLVIEAVGLALFASGYSAAAHQLLPPGEGPLYFAGGALLAVSIIALWKPLTGWLERREAGEFALAGAPRELGTGLALGLVLFSAMAGIVALLGGLEVLGLRGWGGIWAMLAMAVTSGVFEEALFRGIILRHLESLLGTWAALGLTSALFGVAHLFNPDSTPFAALAITLEAGLLLGAAYLYTRRLWLAAGIHAAWNFTQGWVFSVPVSGGKAPLGLLVTRRVGPDWLTGGAFGLEASLVATVVATLAGLVMVWRVVHVGAIAAPPWRRPNSEQLFHADNRTS